MREKFPEVGKGIHICGFRNSSFFFLLASPSDSRPLQLGFLPIASDSSHVLNVAWMPGKSEEQANWENDGQYRLTANDQGPTWTSVQLCSEKGAPSVIGLNCLST